MTSLADRLIALGRARGEFERRLPLIGTDDWHRSTPCTDWDVYALVNHVLGGNTRYTMLLHGASADEVNRTRTDDHVGADPVASFVTTAGELAKAFGEPGVMTRTTHHPLGDRTGAELLAMRVIDLTVHAWDLARALGTDDSLDPQAVEFALAHADVIDAGRPYGSFAGPIATQPGDQSTQARLLHLSGRSIQGDRW